VLPATRQFAGVLEVFDVCYTFGVMKKRSISAIEDIDAIISAITRSAAASLTKLTQMSGPNALHALWALKVQKTGCDPLDAESPLNLIEQLNQTFTYLASAKAVRILLEVHPKLAPFTLNLGTAPGYDIESSKGGGLEAEVFAAVNTRSNQKLRKDLEKMARSTAEHRYVFFMCLGIPEGRQRNLERESGVRVWSVGEVT
jgi:hypothetical protein